MKPIIAGNWKMNKTIAEAVDFARSLTEIFAREQTPGIVIAPPYTALGKVAEVLYGSPISLAAQNVHESLEGKGAFTGEISAPMLVDAGCRYVIVGHSERRHLFGETDAMVNKKIKTALKYGLVPIFCVGETLDQRERNETFAVLGHQLKEGLQNISRDDMGRLVIAYEPVWAIGTGKTATPAQAGEVHGYIRSLLAEGYGEEAAGRLPILYGGSVTPRNIGQLMAVKEINGALVGGASLEVESFVKIVKYEMS